MNAKDSTRELRLGRELRTKINVACHALAQIEAQRVRAVILARVQAAARAGATPAELEALVLDAAR